MQTLVRELTVLAPFHTIFDLATTRKFGEYFNISNCCLFRLIRSQPKNELAATMFPCYKETRGDGMTTNGSAAACSIAIFGGIGNFIPFRHSQKSIPFLTADSVEIWFVTN